MERNDKFKKIITKNRTCYYFDNIIKCEDLDIDISIDEKSYRNIFIYSISYKPLICSKPLRISFNKIDDLISL